MCPSTYAAKKMPLAIWKVRKRSIGRTPSKYPSAGKECDVSDTVTTVAPAERITPEMIEAGVRVLEESGRLIEGLCSGDRLLVQEVFASMLRSLPRGLDQRLTGTHRASR